MILGQDNFNRGPAASLGASWTEQNGGPIGLLSDFDITAAGRATLGAGMGGAGGFAIATMNGTTASVVGLNCWIRVNQIIVAPNSLTCGVVWRFQDTSNFYYAFVFTGAAPAAIERLLVVRVVGGVSTTLNNPPNGTIIGNSTGVPRPYGTGIERMSVQMDANDRISVYAGGRYNTGVSPANTEEGPMWAGVDASPLGGSGDCGICTTVNNLNSQGNMWWDDFICSDLQPETVYFDMGAVGGEGMGTAASPDPGPGYAVNNALIHYGGRIKDLGNTPMTNPTAAIGTTGQWLDDFTIGHDHKFQAQGGERFPTYSELDGSIVDPGVVALTIEGADSVLTPMTDVRGVSFFDVRGFASWIVLRGFDFISGVNNVSRMVGTLSANNIGAGTPHSVVVDKSKLLANQAGQDQLLRYAHSGEMVGARYSYFRTDGVVTLDQFVNIGSGAGATFTEGVDFSYSIFEGSGQRCFQIIGTIGAAAVAEFAHCHFIDIEHAPSTTSIIEVANAANVLGEIELRDSILVTRGANPTDFGIRILAGAPAGTITRHHNRYARVVTPASPGVVDGGGELEGVGPAFFDETQPYTWPQTASSPAYTLPSDWRPTAVEYKGTASDDYSGVDLDIGALQVIVLPWITPIGTGARIPDFCIQVIYDPDGIALDLSNRLIDMRPVRQEKDIALRRYVVSDTHLEVSDPEGLFIPTSPSTVLTATWRDTPVAISLFDRAGTSLFTYKGFLIGRTATRGVSRLRLANRFQRVLKQGFLATHAGKIVSTTGEVGLPVAFGSLPSGGQYLSDIRPNYLQGCGIETWTITFTSATDFTISGSVTGDDGAGDIFNPFVSDSGRVIINQADWSAGPFAAGDECSIRTVYRPLIFAGATTIDLLLDLLTAVFAADLDLADVDQSVFDLQGSAVDRPLKSGTNFPYVVDEEGISVLDEIERVARHMLAVVIEKADSRIGLYAYVPRLGTPDLDVICKHVDLMAAAQEDTPIYNDFRYEYEYNEAEERYEAAHRYPATDADNPSLAQHGRQRAPVAELKGFDAGELSWIQSLSQQEYTRWRDLLPLWELSLTADRLGLEIDELYRLDSEGPTATGFVEPSTIKRVLTRDPKIEIRAFDVSFYVQVPGACGYLFHDVGHRHDDCWVHF